MSGVLSFGECFPLMGFLEGGASSGEPGAFLLARAEEDAPFMIVLISVIYDGKRDDDVGEGEREFGSWLKGIES